MISISPVASQSVGAKNVETTESYVGATMKCSCSHYTNYEYHDRYFRNYCPYCHSKGNLYFEQGEYLGYNKGTCPEGTWVCGNCDKDFCGVHGKSHDSDHLFLIRCDKPLKPKQILQIGLNAISKDEQMKELFKGFKTFSLIPFLEA